MNIKNPLKIAASALGRQGAKGAINLCSSALNLLTEPPRMNSNPLYAQIEPTLFCNLNCSMCVNPLSPRRRQHMSLENFKKILNKLSYLRQVSLVGAGEPLLNPDLFGMISYAKAKGVLIGFATNGLLLNRLCATRILEARVDWLNVSIDSADKYIYGAIRKGADLGVVINNLKDFMKIKGKRRLPELSLWVVIMEQTVSGIGQIIKLSKELGINKVTAQLAHSWGEASLAESLKHNSEKDFFEKLKETLIQAKKLARKESVVFDFVNVPDVSSRRACKWPWKSCYISVEGFITPCCLQGSNPETLNFGNILGDDDFDSIWNGPEYQEFRKNLKSKGAPDICSGCTSYFRCVKL